MGIMDPHDIDKLLTPAYQRGALPVTSLTAWETAFYEGEVPPLDLGSHKGRYIPREDGGATISGDVNLIDGLQRTRAARLVLGRGGEVWLPVVVYLKTTYAWELARFSILNAKRRQVSTNILLRNSQESNQALGALYKYTDGQVDTVLSGRVQWEQDPHKGNLLSAVSLVQVAARLHTHFGVNLRNSKTEPLAWALDDVVAQVSPELFMANVDTFFQLIGKAAGIRTLKKANVVQLRLGYMLSMAKLLAGHANFWDGQQLVLSREVVDALAEFRLDSATERDISNRGRPMPTVVDGMAKTARSALHTKLYPW
jgi:hypothetical protein